MMKKKLSMIAFAALTLVMTSCGSEADGEDEKAKDGASLATEVCECTTKANALPADDPNRRGEQDKCSKLQADNWNIIKGDPKEEKAFNGEFPCGL